MAAGLWMQREGKGAWKPPRRPFSLSSSISDDVDGTVHACRDSDLQMANVTALIFTSSAPKRSLIPLRGQKATGKAASDEASRVSPRKGLAMAFCLRMMGEQVEGEPKREQRWLPLSRKTTGHQLAKYFSLESLTAPLVLGMVALALGQVADWLEKGLM